MVWQGKLIGAFLGLLFTGGSPLGFLIGFLIGHAFDQNRFTRSRTYQNRYSNSYQHIQQTFFKATFLVMGHIAKADGRVSEREILTARSIMAQMNLSNAQKQQAISFFNQGKQTNFNLAECLDELLRVCYNQQLLLNLFFEIQQQITFADLNTATAQDAVARERKQRILRTIGQRLGLGSFQYNYTQQQRANNDSYSSSYRQQHSSSHNTKTSTLTEAFLLLDIKETANKHEIKRAYRKKMSQHHPDKLIAQGLPPSMIKLATDKTQKIQAAYEQIRSAKGF